MQSIWSDNLKLPSFEPVRQDIKTDVAIIGGGMAGLMCAYKLKQQGIDCVVLEANKICSGVTQNTTAKITSQHGFIYHKLYKNLGKEMAQMYFTANQNALEEYKTLCKEIDCDFEIKDNIVYSLDSAKVDREILALDKLGIKYSHITKTPLPFEIKGGIKFSAQAQFNPLKFISQIASEFNIYEHTKVIEINGNKAITEKATVYADNFIVATHFPFMNKYGMYFAKMYQQRSYVIALQKAPDVNGMYVDEAAKGMSFRNYGNYLLIGGGDHRTGKKGGNYRELRRFSSIHYPTLKERYHFATQDCITLDGMAYIGKYSKKLPNVYVATGFNKWGMSTSMLAANILADMIKFGSNDYEKIFSPSRNFLKPKLLINGFETVAGLATPSAKRCPHLGCALKWNEAEHTWDCPCHGSRFTKDGKLIENPATDDLK